MAASFQPSGEQTKLSFSASLKKIIGKKENFHLFAGGEINMNYKLKEILQKVRISCQKISNIIKFLSVLA